jgi:transcriptional/translational regulatory protein YebC/TACO1
MMDGSSFGGGIHIPADKNMKDIPIGAWLAFTKNYQADIYTKAIVLEGRDERICTNGSVKFYAPKFKLNDVDPKTDAEAIALTQVLKQYMTEYFKKSASQTEIATHPESEEELAQRVEQANTAVHATNEEPKMSNHEAVFGTPEPREPEYNNDVSNLVDDLPF